MAVVVVVAAARARGPCRVHRVAMMSSCSPCSQLCVCYPCEVGVLKRARMRVVHWACGGNESERGGGGGGGGWWIGE